MRERDVFGPGLPHQYAWTETQVQTHSGLKTYTYMPRFIIFFSKRIYEYIVCPFCLFFLYDSLATISDMSFNSKNLDSEHQLLQLKI